MTPRQTLTSARRLVETAQGVASMKSALQLSATALVLLGMLEGCGSHHQDHSKAAYQMGYQDGQNGVAATEAKQGVGASGNYQVPCNDAALSEGISGADRQYFMHGCVDALTARYGSK